MKRQPNPTLMRTLSLGLEPPHAWSLLLGHARRACLRQALSFTCVSSPSPSTASTLFHPLVFRGRAGIFPRFPHSSPRRVPPSPSPSPASARTRRPSPPPVPAGASADTPASLPPNPDGPRTPEEGVPAGDANTMSGRQGSTEQVRGTDQEKIRLTLASALWDVTSPCLHLFFHLPLASYPRL